MSPDGAHVYVSAFEGTLAVFARNDGNLAFVEVHRDGEAGVDGLARAAWVAVSADGRHVYVPGAFDNGVAVFERDRASGALSFAGIVRNGENGVEGLTWARSIALSSDGAHAYVTGLGDKALVVFERDRTTGLLGFVQVLRDGVDGVDGLEWASSAILSPDEGHVYATGADVVQLPPSDRAVAVFQRDRITGELTFVEAHFRPQLGAISSAISPDGRRVHVAGGQDGIGVYSRDPTSGELQLRQEIVNGEGGVEGLVRLFHIARSPDGAYVYTAAQGEEDVAGAVAVFRVVDEVCAGDANGDGQVRIHELILAVNNALAGCPE